MELLVVIGVLVLALVLCVAKIAHLSGKEAYKKKLKQTIIRAELRRKQEDAKTLKNASATDTVDFLNGVSAAPKDND